MTVSHISLQLPQVQVVGSDEEEIQHIYQWNLEHNIMIRIMG
jgi:hypothetical protein